MYVDSHAHLEGPRFAADREQVLERARAAGVETILCIGNGNGPGTLDCAVKLAEKYAGLYATTGIHPHEARLADEAAYAELERVARHEKVIAWGEIGLDYWYDHSPRDAQREAFVRQMGMARAAQLPIVLHIRAGRESDAAWEEAFELLQQHWAASGLGGIFHCFTGNAAQARRAVEMGFHVSFSGMVTFPKSVAIQQAARECPAERMLIETDAPYLAPQPHRGQRNEPAYVVETARFLAELRGVSVEELGEQTTRNFQALFGLEGQMTSDEW